jgi:hypothetical protein
VACHQNPQHACDLIGYFKAANAEQAIQQAIAERQISDPLTQSRLAAQKVREVG